MAVVGFLDDLPELVQDSRLEVVFGNDGDRFYTSHLQSSSYQTRGKKDKWFHKRTLGIGGQGSVDLQVQGIDDDGSGMGAQYRAVKKIRISDDKKQYQLYQRELLAIFKFSQARYSDLFVKSHGWFANESHVHIAMEYLELGDLQNYLSDSKRCPSRRLTEGHAQTIACQVVDALNTMHKVGFSHRDLKPANILIKQQPPKPWWVKLADFGISKRGGEQTDSSEIRGTPNFMPPELFTFSQSSKTIRPFAIDMWCFGETLYRMLSGRSTFRSINEMLEYSSGGLGFPRHVLRSHGVDETAVNFLESLMAVDPSRRLTAGQASIHHWIQCTSPSINLTICPELLESTSKGFEEEQAISSRPETTVEVASASWTTDELVIRNPPSELMNSIYRPNAGRAITSKSKTESAIDNVSALSTAEPGMRNLLPTSTGPDQRVNSSIPAVTSQHHPQLPHTKSSGSSALILLGSSVPEGTSQQGNIRIHGPEMISFEPPVGVENVPFKNIPSNFNHPFEIIKPESKRAPTYNGDMAASAPETAITFSDPTSLSLTTSEGRIREGVTGSSVSRHSASEPSEIGFPKGIRITNIQISDNRWWIGQFEGKTGLFPACAVKLHDPSWHDPDAVQTNRSEIMIYAFDLWEESKPVRRSNRGAPIAVLESSASGSFLTKNYISAERYLRAALELLRISSEKTGSRVIRDRILLAYSVYNQDRYNDARAEFQILLHDIKPNPRKNNIQTLCCMQGLAAVLYMKEEYDKAENLYRELVVEHKRPFGCPLSYEDIYACQFYLGKTLYRLGNFDEAEEIFQGIIQLLKVSHGPCHSYVRGSMQDLAGIFYKQNRFEEAVPILEELAASMATSAESTDAQEIHQLYRLASSYQNLDRQGEALLVYRQVVQLTIAHRGYETAETGAAMHTLAGLLILQKEFSEAEKYLRESYRLRRISRKSNRRR